MIHANSGSGPKTGTQPQQICTINWAWQNMPLWKPSSAGDSETTLYIMDTGAALKKRLLSLDVFRGVTVAAMILVNNPGDWGNRSEEHTSELQSLMRSSYAVFCLQKKTNTH